MWSVLLLGLLTVQKDGPLCVTDGDTDAVLSWRSQVQEEPTTNNTIYGRLKNRQDQSVAIEARMVVTVGVGGWVWVGKGSMGAPQVLGVFASDMGGVVWTRTCEKTQQDVRSGC